MGRPNTSKMATTSGKSSGAQTTRGWDPYKTFDVSEKEMQLVQERAKVRNALKAEYQKKISYPFRGIGGYIFDPSVQRFYRCVQSILPISRGHLKTLPSSLEL